MKKVITLILFIACACSKDTPADKACYSCIKTTTNIALNGHQESMDQTSSYCGITKDDAIDIEKAGTNSMVDGTTTIKTSTTCTKKQ